jgi:hypothetical protein
MLRGKGTIHEMTVPTATIDDIVAETRIPRVDLVIITVNGAEVEALKGMDRTLEKDVHLVIAAKYIVEGMPTHQRVTKLLEDKGYRCILDHYGFTKNENPEQQAVIYAGRE